MHIEEYRNIRFADIPQDKRVPLYRGRRLSIDYALDIGLIFRNGKRARHLADAKQSLFQHLITHPGIVQPDLILYLDRFPDAKILPLTGAQLERIRGINRPLIMRLRLDLAALQPSLAECIQTVRGSGYIYVPNPSISGARKIL